MNLMHRIRVSEIRRQLTEWCDFNQIKLDEDDQVVNGFFSILEKLPEYDNPAMPRVEKFSLSIIGKWDISTIDYKEIENAFYFRLAVSYKGVELLDIELTYLYDKSYRWYKNLKEYSDKLKVYLTEEKQKELDIEVEKIKRPQKS